MYLDYEGEISGNRGTVHRVAEGSYTAEVWEEGRVRVRLHGSQLVGDVEIRQVVPASDGEVTWVFRMGKVD
jgi:hypothetical protein